MTWKLTCFEESPIISNFHDYQFKKAKNIHKFFFRILTRVKRNYLCAHLQVWSVEANGIVWWPTFQVPDRWNSTDLVIENSKWDATLPFEYELSWTAFLVSGTPQQWISRKKYWKTNIQKIIFDDLKIDAFRFLDNHPYEKLKKVAKFFVYLIFSKNIFQVFSKPTSKFSLKLFPDGPFLCSSITWR